VTARERTRRALPAVLLILGLSQLALGLWMVISPGSFYDALGPFGERNDHYLADVATFYLALGAAALVAARRPGWRLPVLGFAAIQYTLHAVNHLVDIGEADPGWVGPFDFVTLALSAAGLAWLTEVARR
jgi:hypothetical protein